MISCSFFFLVPVSSAWVEKRLLRYFYISFFLIIGFAIVKDFIIFQLHSYLQWKCLHAYVLCLFPLVLFWQNLPYIQPLQKDRITLGLERTLSTGNFDVKRFRMHRKGMTQVIRTFPTCMAVPFQFICSNNFCG